ncbi:MULTISPECIES: ribonuclease P protein component [Bacillaceae]|uniref:Ribonuclease P protein component n=1 Tax=Evansella alkalicola TaxID=745819 RepID=A0ABS6JUR7_9BACI|nr:MULTISPECIES: ribonuclease P protein component [Bacillaceae]MBU9722299.1 ribonuclease P protein component [Bacillus alkalicola]
MKKENRLKKNEEFQVVFQRGSSVANRQFVVYKLKKTDQKNIRIGLSVSKKLGNAVIRNRIKRLLREGLRELIPSLNGSYDVVLIARKPVTEMDMLSINKSLKHVFKLGKLLK